LGAYNVSVEYFSTIGNTWILLLGLFAKFLDLSHKSLSCAHHSWTALEAVEASGASMSPLSLMSLGVATGLLAFFI